MGELRLTLDRKDIAMNRFVVNEQEHLKSASRAAWQKKKAVVPAKEEDKEEKQEEEQHAGSGTL